MNWGRAIYVRHGVMLPAARWNASQWTAVTFRHIRSVRRRPGVDAAIERDLIMANTRRRAAYLHGKYERDRQNRALSP